MEEYFATTSTSTSNNCNLTMLWSDNRWCNEICLWLSSVLYLKDIKKPGKYVECLVELAVEEKEYDEMLCDLCPI